MAIRGKHFFACPMISVEWKREKLLPFQLSMEDFRHYFAIYRSTHLVVRHDGWHTTWKSGNDVSKTTPLSGCLSFIQFGMQHNLISLSGGIGVSICMRKIYCFHTKHFLSCISVAVLGKIKLWWTLTIIKVEQNTNQCHGTTWIGP